MAVTEEPQHSIYETMIDNPDAEALLEKRQKAKEAKEAKGAVTKRFKDADDAAKVSLAELDLGVGAPVRIGRFVVGLNQRDGREVSFSTAPSTQLSIRTLPDDEQ